MQWWTCTIHIHLCKFIINFILWSYFV